MVIPRFPFADSQQLNGRIKLVCGANTGYCPPTLPDVTLHGSPSENEEKAACDQQAAFLLSIEML
jgi:hypothetical protein